MIGGFMVFLEQLQKLQWSCLLGELKNLLRLALLYPAYEARDTDEYPFPSS